VQGQEENRDREEHHDQAQGASDGIVFQNHHHAGNHGDRGQYAE